MRETEKPEGNRYIKNHFALDTLPTNYAEDKDNNTKDKIDESYGVPSEFHSDLLVTNDGVLLKIIPYTK